MDNKYLFRVYHVDNKGDLLSPFVSSDSTQFGKRSIASKPKSSDDNLDDFNEFGNLWHKGKLYPKHRQHYGFSAFGKVDPRYSIFSSEDDLDDDDVLEAVQKSISKYVPEEAHGKRTLAKYYKGNEKDDFDFLSNHAYHPRKRTEYIQKFNGDKGSAQSFTISPEYFDFDSDRVWDDFVYDIDMYDTFHRLHPYMPDEGDRVVLVTTPEDKIISADDLVKHGYTQQRDFPSELVTSEITPLRVFSEYPKAVDKYDSLRDRGASGQEAFAESFKIEPKKIVSDEQLKDIYKDICHNNDNIRRHSSILKGIKGFRQ